MYFCCWNRFSRPFLWESAKEGQQLIGTLMDLDWVAPSTHLRRRHVASSHGGASHESSGPRGIPGQEAGETLVRQLQLLQPKGERGNALDQNTC